MQREAIIPFSQADQLRQLNLAGNSDAVIIQQFENGSVSFTRETLAEYIKALTRLDRLDSSRVMSLIHRGAEIEKGESSAGFVSNSMHQTSMPPPPPPPSFWSVPPPPSHTYAQATPTASFFGSPSIGTSASHALGGVVGSGAGEGAMGTNKNPVIMAFVSTRKERLSSPLLHLSTHLSLNS